MAKGVTKAIKKKMHELALAEQILEDELGLDVSSHSIAQIEKMAKLLRAIAKLRREVNWDDREE